MSVSRRVLPAFDWRLVAAAVGLAALSVLIIYSTSGMHASLFRRSLYLKQATWMVMGVFAMVLLCVVPYRTTWSLAYPLYAFLLVALLLVALIGRTGMGAQRWLSIGSFAFQPSEFMKLSLIILLARYFEDRKDELHTPRIFILPIILTLVPMAFVLRQPDLGTAIMLLLISASILVVMGLKIRYLVLLGAAGAAVAPVLWHFLHDYQKNRVLVFIYPDMDPMGAGYHVAQSKIAVGSGGLIGKGWMAATQSQLNFLPENHTDFIFAGLAEQWGFIGSLGLLLVYAYLLSRGLRLAKDAHDLFTMVTSFGIVCMMAWQVVINVGMVTGIMPVVGIPLPLLSYGGSSMLMNMLAVGCLLNIQKHRYLY
ncbi:Rod shape-determining protein rodA [Candidatus Methylomirabilis oxygeniifera]|uniref:Peptidoglycan glycosyltransferase RodA n=1 Tax=Methylomirabilis oxygeniifera TaxID=671143 RepID=D5MN66_METO1|nr:Rod shape-determining protein rodA [Candidatus Methylomirabilis oxyfera]